MTLEKVSPFFDWSSPFIEQKILAASYQRLLTFFYETAQHSRSD